MRSTLSADLGRFGRHPRPAELVLACYLGLTATLLLVLGRHLDGWLWIVLSHGFMIAVLFVIARSGQQISPLFGLLRRLLPLIASGALYKESGILVDLLHHGWRFDPTILRFEQTMFGGDPSQSLHTLLPFPVLSEILHFAYVSYFVLPLIPIAFLLRRNAIAELDSFLTVFTAVFVSCQLWFIVMPVVGPYHAFGPPVNMVGGWFTDLAHRLVSSGSSLGTAFPSSHVAVTVAVWIAAMRTDRTAGWILMIVTPVLTLATVYGGFHYATDAIAGLIWGVLAAEFATFFHERAESLTALPSQTE